MSKARDEIIQMFAQHVSPGKVDLYAKYDILLVPGKRGGALLRDMDGKAFLNCHSNGGVFNLGHRNPRIIKAVTEAMKSYDISNHHLVSGPRAVLARMLAETMPNGLDQVVYGVSGGEAVDLALQLARGVTGRKEIVSAKGGYHGHTGFALATGDRKYREKFSPMPPGFRQVPFNSIERLERAVSEKTAAVIFETIPATMGIVVPDREYFRAARRVCDRHGALLIMDEVQTGFGRTGRFWGFEHFRIKPDIVVMGKGMSGGIYPISATVYHRKYRWFFREDPFVHISTCGGSEIGCHAAMEVIRISREPSFLEHVRFISGLLRRGIEDISLRYPDMKMKARGIGLMMGIEFRDEITALLLVKLFFENGIYVVYANNDPRVIQFLPVLVMTEKEAETVLKKIDRAVKTLEGSGGQNK